MFDNELLRAFVGVAEGGGFTRAAERLHLTQSAVSAQIKRLETQTGCALLTRSHPFGRAHSTGRDPSRVRAQHPRLA
jgi:DNA-binding transcriptional LysR family regulator